MFELRPYQREAVAAAITHLRRSIEPAIIEAATGAGKSLLVAEIARYIHEMTGKRILCTAPSATLVMQNHEKYVATGNSASVFSASAGIKSLRHPVVFGTPTTIKNKISAFKKDFALILIDECDLITPSIRSIIEEMREGNPNLRVFGLTGTPYRLGSGYIYREGPDGKVNGEDVCREPYYGKCVYQIAAPKLIAQGYLTKPIIGRINADRYDTESLKPNAMGQFDSKAVDVAYHGHGRKTAAIVGDIVAQSQNRKGALIFAATVRHAQEIMASLPPELSSIITDKTKDRQAILNRFKRRELKYLVNVAVLTVGIDLPHVDVVAVLRKTESARLLQQIIGRGLRLSEGKEDCLYLDYSDNPQTHFPNGDVFAPEITAKAGPSGGNLIESECEECHYVNNFKLNPEFADYVRDVNGYCMDTFGDRIKTDYGPMPAHYGRRCFGMVKQGAVDEYVRCGYRWTGKDCLTCGEKNDISARYCFSCKAEIVDPNDKLVSDFKALKRDPTKPQTDHVLSMTAVEGISRNMNKTVRVDFVTPYRQFSIYYLPDSSLPMHRSAWNRYCDATMDGSIPETVSYAKDIETAFYKVLAFNRPEDSTPNMKAKEVFA